MDDSIYEPSLDDSINEPTVDDSTNEPTVDDSINEPTVGNSINEPNEDDSVTGNDSTSDTLSTVVDAINPAVRSGDFKNVVDLMEQRALSNNKVLSAYQPFFS